MNTKIRALLTDLKAAARIGHPESVNAALDGLRALPDVAANHPITDELINKAILPMGIALASSRLDLGYLQSLLKEPLAALRALAAVSLVNRALRGNDDSFASLEFAAKDSRQDVRITLARAFENLNEEFAEKTLSLISEWMSNNSPRLQEVALMAIPYLPHSQSRGALDLLETMSLASDPDVRAALVIAVTSLAEGGLSQETLALLKDWSQQERPNTWVIARSLSSSWAAQEVDAAIIILEQLGRQKESTKQVINALQALSRRGAQETVYSAMEDWRENANDNLRHISNKVMPENE